jgi:hypothetical protein
MTSRIDDILPHPDERVPLAELRAQFRAANLARIREQLVDYRVNGVRMKMLGEPIGGSASHRARALDRALCEPVRLDFGLDEVPSDIIARVSKLASEAATHDSVTWDSAVSGVSDLDAPPCDLAAMTDDELCDYVARAISESASAKEDE